MIDYESRAPFNARRVLTFGLLPCQSDRRVHAVYDVAERYPLAVCGSGIIADVWLPGPALLCTRCLAALPDPDAAELRPAADEHRQLAPIRPEHAARPLVAMVRWYCARQYDRRVRRAINAEWRHA